MTSRSFSSFLLVSFAASCAGYLPEFGKNAPLPVEADRAAPSHSADVVEAVPSASASSAPDPVLQARRARSAAYTVCDAVLANIPKQKLALKNIAYNRKQGGLLVTTAIGAVGSIVTAIFAGTQSADSKGNVDTRAAVIAGASTAGATAIAGVISLFVVGATADDAIANLEKTEGSIGTVEREMESDCTGMTSDTAPKCEDRANRAKDQCTKTAWSLPYAVPGLPPPPSGRTGR